MKLKKTVNKENKVAQHKKVLTAEGKKRRELKERKTAKTKS